MRLSKGCRTSVELPTGTIRHAWASKHCWSVRRPNQSTLRVLNAVQKLADSVTISKTVERLLEVLTRLILCKASCWIPTSGIVENGLNANCVGSSFEGCTKRPECSTKAYLTM